MLIVVLVLCALAALYHIAGAFGLILPGAVCLLRLLRAAASAARRYNPAPPPLNTHRWRR